MNSPLMVAGSVVAAVRREVLQSHGSRTTAFLGALSGIALGFALLREAAVAYYFGAAPELDAFLVAASAPRVIGATFATATVGVLVPEYIHLRDSRGRAAAAQLARRWLGLTFIVTGAAALIVAALPAPVVRAQAPGLAPRQLHLAQGLLRGLCLTALLLGMAGTTRAILNANRCFWKPAVQGGVISAAVVACCAVLAGRIGVWALVAGTLLGAACALALQVGHADLRRWAFSTGGPVVRLPLGFFGLVLGANTANSCSPVVDRWFSSRFAPGTISQLNYATTLFQAPALLLMAPLVTFLLPRFSECVTGRDSHGLRRVASKGIVYCLVACVGPAALLASFAPDVVAVALARGKFDARDAAATATFLRILSPALLLNSLVWCLSQFLLATRRHGLLLFGQIGRLVLKTGAAALLVRSHGANALPLSTLVASAVALPIFWVLAATAYARHFSAGKRPR